MARPRIKPEVPDADQRAVRLKIMELMLPVANRIGLGNPDTIVEKADVLEKYVLFGKRVDNELSKEDSSVNEVLTD